MTFDLIKNNSWNKKIYLNIFSTIAKVLNMNFQFSVAFKRLTESVINTIVLGELILQLFKALRIVVASVVNICAFWFNLNIVYSFDFSFKKTHPQPFKLLDSPVEIMSTFPSSAFIVLCNWTLYAEITLKVV